MAKSNKPMGRPRGSGIIDDEADMAEVANMVAFDPSDVTFDAAPTRAVSNDVNLTEMMLALGLTGNMVGYTGVSDWKTLDEKLREGVAQLPELSPDYPTKEVLLGADADFYFAGWNYDMKVGGEVTPDTLGEFGIKVYELTESCIHIMDKPKVTIDDLYVDLLNLGKIFGVEEKAVALVEGYEQEPADFQATLPKAESPPKVFVYSKQMLDFLNHLHDAAGERLLRLKGPRLADRRSRQAISAAYRAGHHAPAGAVGRLAQ